MCGIKRLDINNKSYFEGVLQNNKITTTKTTKKKNIVVKLLHKLEGAQDVSDLDVLDLYVYVCLDGIGIWLTYK